MRHIRPAFSAMEILLVIAIMTILFAVAIPFTYQFRNQQLRSVLQHDLVQVLRQVQMRALQSEQGDDWGVRMQGGAFVLYRGSSYATRDPSFDITYRVQDSVTWTGLPEVTFRRSRGTPQTPGTLGFSGPDGSGAILINAMGGIFFQ